LAFAAALAGCGSATTPDPAASAEPSAAASDAAAAGADQPANLAVAGPDGNVSSPGKHDSSDSADAGHNEAATDENGNPVAASPPQPTEEDVRRAVEEAQNK
jgi:hypothetical protein